MLYKLLGMLVWKVGKRLLRRRYGPTYAPKPLLAGIVVLAVAGLAAILLRRDERG